MAPSEVWVAARSKRRACVRTCVRAYVGARERVGWLCVTSHTLGQRHNTVNHVSYDDGTCPHRPSPNAHTAKRKNERTTALTLLRAATNSASVSECSCFLDIVNPGDENVFFFDDDDDARTNDARTHDARRTTHDDTAWAIANNQFSLCQSH